MLLLTFPETELVISHIQRRLLLIFLKDVSTSLWKLEFWLLFLFLYLFELSRFFGLESFAFSTLFLVWAFKFRWHFRCTFRLDLFGITMRCLDMPIANRQGLAGLFPVVCVFFWLLFSYCTLKLPVVFKALFLLLLMLLFVLILIMVSLFTHISMVLAVFAVAMCRATNFIFPESGPMQ